MGDTSKNSQPAISSEKDFSLALRECQEPALMSLDLRHNWRSNEKPQMARSVLFLAEGLILHTIYKGGRHEKKCFY